MKKIITLVLAVALALTAMVSCSINDTEVAVIWSDREDPYIFEISDALDRAMYIENVKYEHHDAKGDGEEQVRLVDAAIAAGAPVIVVNPTDAATAVAVLKKIKDAGIPVVFLCSDVATIGAIAAVDYEKAYTVDVAIDSLAKVLGENIAVELAESYGDFDRDDDGKISYASFGLIGKAAEPFINAKLAALKADKKAPKGLKDVENPSVYAADFVYNPIESYEKNVDNLFADFAGVGSNEVKPTKAELIIYDDSSATDDILLAMRDYELNYGKLVTHFIPAYTVGITDNMGAMLAEDAKQEEKDAYSVMSVIDSGYLAGAARIDDNGLASSVASIVKALIKGDDVYAEVNEDYVKDGAVLVPYAFYG